MALKGTSLAHKGKYSSTLTGCLLARASSNHYSLVRPITTRYKSAMNLIPKCMKYLYITTVAIGKFGEKQGKSPK